MRVVCQLWSIGPVRSCIQFFVIQCALKFDICEVALSTLQAVASMLFTCVMIGLVAAVSCGCCISSVMVAIIDWQPILLCSARAFHRHVAHSITSAAHSHVSPSLSV